MAESRPWTQVMWLQTEHYYILVIRQTATAKGSWIFIVFKSCNKPRQHIKKQRHHFANKGPYNQSYVFSSSHVQMWKVDQKESGVPKYWCFQTAVLKKTLESPLDCKEIKPINPKGTQPWIFIGKTDSEAEATILWPPDANSRLIRKDLDAGKDWGQEDRGQRGWNGWVASPTQWIWV